jgi:hypothetical protein
VSDHDPPFEPTSNPETAGTNELFEPVNVCRVVALGAAFGSERALEGLQRELGDMGLPEYLAGNTDWSWDDAVGRNGREVLGDQRSREEVFAALRTEAWPAGAVAFLAQVLSSPLERESAAAAAAIWVASGRRTGFGRRGVPRRHWYRFRDFYGFPLDLPGAFGPWGTAPDWTYDPDLETRPPNALGWPADRWQMVAREFLDHPDEYPGDSPDRIEELAAMRLSMAMRSEDPIARQFAMASLARIGRGDDDAQGGGVGRAPIPGAVSVSAIIHGTWGWKGDWWRPGASFHDYVRQEVRGNIYSRGAPFSWSGAYSDRQRRIAAEDFQRWAEEISPRGIDTLLSHSYGGEVATRAWSLGAKIHEIVLLSTPATQHVRSAVDRGLRTVDIRLPFDPVLALARTPQRIRRKAPNLTQVVLPQWHLSHGATHDSDVWQSEDLVKQARL